MAMQTDIRSAYTAATGVLVAGRTRLRGYQFMPGGTAGDVIFRDGGASGSIVLQFSIAMASLTLVSAILPGEGILCTTNIHVTLPTAATVAIFYG